MADRLELHRARMRKGIDLARISATTALTPGMAARIDEGRFEELPSGLYARSYIRTFARAVGVSPEEALAWAEPYLPKAEDPLPALKERAPRDPFEGLREYLATQIRPFSEHSLFTAGSLRRAGAASIDASLLTSIGLLMITAAAWICRIGVGQLLEVAGTALALMFAVPVALYFMLIEGLGARTLGKVVCQPASASRRLVVRVRHWSYVTPAPGRAAAATPRRDAGRHDRGAESLALRSAPARR